MFVQHAQTLDQRQLRFIRRRQLPIPLILQAVRGHGPEKPPRSPPNMAPSMLNMTTKMITAGIAAIADLTMNTTIDMNGILISTIVTSLLFSILFSFKESRRTYDGDLCLETIWLLRLQYLGRQGTRAADSDESAAKIATLESKEFRGYARNT